MLVAKTKICFIEMHTPPLMSAKDLNSIIWCYIIKLGSKAFPDLYESVPHLVSSSGAKFMCNCPLHEYKRCSTSIKFDFL